MTVTTEMIIGLIGSMATVVAISVGITTLLAKRDSKTVTEAKMEQSLSQISSNVSNLSVDVKAGFRDVNSRLSQIESKVTGLEIKTEIQQRSIDKAHERIDKALDEKGPGG